MRETVTERPPDWRAGAVAGIVGAFVYTAFVEVVNVAANGATIFFQPFRQIGAVVLGHRALDANYSLAAALAAGSVVHLAIAVAFGILLLSVTSRTGRPSAGAAVFIGLAAGLALYALDVFVIFPAAFPWFLANSRITQTIGHALFGAATGAWLVRLTAAR